MRPRGRIDIEIDGMPSRPLSDAGLWHIGQFRDQAKADD
jgi:hypothetical protein